MNVVCCYCHPSMDMATYQPMARKWVETYHANPPGSSAHELYVLVNGFKYPLLDTIFKSLPVKYMVHSNVGKDIGAYQKAAETIPCDLMIFFGSPVFFTRPGWLDWLIECYLKHGPGMYGAFAYQVPIPHIRTTCFWCPPDLLNSYPSDIGDGQRYSFEHGPDSLSMWAKRMGLGTFQVTWDGVYEMQDWHQSPRSKCLFIDQHVMTHHIA